MSINLSEQAAAIFKLADQLDGMAHSAAFGLNRALQDAASKGRDFASALGTVKQNLPPAPPPKKT